MYRVDRGPTRIQLVLLTNPANQSCVLPSQLFKGSLVINLCSMARLPLLSLLFLSLAQGKLPDPPSSDPAPRCRFPPCVKTLVRVGVYLDPGLWTAIRKGRKLSGVQERAEGLVREINKHLARLDEGGFKVVIEGRVISLANSEINLKNTFVDRNDGNKTKRFSANDIVSQTFAFQEAVLALPQARREEVDLRILLMREGPNPSLGTAEEWCVCNQHKVTHL